VDVGRSKSASLIGRLRSSAFRLSTGTVLMSLAGSRFSSDSGPFFVPTRTPLTSMRAQKLSRLAVAPTLRSPLSGAVQSRHNLVFGRSKDPNHDAVMRIGSEAPKRRTHSSIRRISQGASSGFLHLERHRHPVTSIRTRPKLCGAFSFLRSFCRTQNNAVRYNALPHEPPQGDQ
jgi:hypothetical protein